MKTVSALTGTLGLAVVVLLAGCVVPIDSNRTRANVASNPLVLEDLRALSKAGVNDDTIISQIKATRTIYHLTATQIIELKNDGISQKIIDHMINTALNQSSQEAATVESSSSGAYYFEPGLSYDYYYSAPYPVVEIYSSPFPLFWPRMDYRSPGGSRHPEDIRPHRDDRPRANNPPPENNRRREDNRPQEKNQPGGNNHRSPPSK